MKRILLVLPLVLLSGCFSKPNPQVNEAMDFRDQALLNYSANTDVIVGAILDGYRQAALKQVEDFYQQDLKKVASNMDASGKVDAAKAVQFLLEADQIRQQRKQAIEEQVSKALAAYNESKKDLVIAQKLNQVLKAYENAGVDITAAQTAAQQIISILKPAK